MNFFIDLKDMLERDLSAYEFYCSLSNEIKAQLDKDDPTSFKEMESLVKEYKEKGHPDLKQDARIIN